MKNKIEEKFCAFCGEVIKNNNKKYCSKECRYSCSNFKNYTWNSKENLEQNPKLKEIFEKSKLKLSNTLKENHKSGKTKSWNEGLTKETNDSIKKMSESRKGKNNPIFKVIDDKEKYDSWCNNISKSLKNSDKLQSGKNLEEKFGKERADVMKEKLKQSALKRTIHGHFGKKHSEESKEKMRIKTSKRISEGKFKTFSEPMKKFKKMFDNIKSDYELKTEFHFDFYSLDFAIEELKLAIEIDGDFWHSNPIFYPEGPKYKTQTKNKMNDIRKEKYIISKNWNLIRFWENDINNNLEEVKKLLLEKINEISKIK